MAYIARLGTTEADDLGSHMTRNASTDLQQVDDETLEAKVKTWFESEGYPIEFAVANEFSQRGFRVFQGYYVRDEKKEINREIDVLAQMSSLKEQHLMRVCYVAECKWTKDKPWVVFTSRDSSIHPAACIAQTISTQLGSALLWTMADNPTLHGLDAFSTPERPGFNGHQAFTKGADQFYSALTSVTTQASLLMGEYDQAPSESSDGFPFCAAIVFPVVVINGPLFEAYFDVNKMDVVVAPASRLRCHWRGAPSWNLHATVDIIQLEYVDEFVTERANEAEYLTQQLTRRMCELIECRKKGSLDELGLPEGGTGISGMPSLLREIVKS